MNFTLIEGACYDRVVNNAKLASIGGISRVREVEMRDKFLSEDQIVGQLGEFALARWFHDEDYYFQRRDLINLNPTEGDGGEDYPDHIDIKSSLRRSGRDPFEYRLVVRPHERHLGNRYVLGVAEGTSAPVTFWLVGWAKDEDLTNLHSSGIFAGAYVVEGRDLRSMGTLEEKNGK